MKRIDKIDWFKNYIRPGDKILVTEGQDELELEYKHHNVWYSLNESWSAIQYRYRTLENNKVVFENRFIRDIQYKNRYKRY